MDYLSLLTKTTTVNGLTFRMFPYQTGRTLDEYGRLKAVFGDDSNIPINMQSHLVLDANTLDIAATDDADDAHRALALFWQDRPATFVERYNAFYSVMPTDVRSTWIDAHDAIRPKQEAAHPEQPGDDAPEA